MRQETASVCNLTITLTRSCYHEVLSWRRTRILGINVGMAAWRSRIGCCVDACIRVSRKMKSVNCSSVDLSIFCSRGNNQQIWNLSTCRQINRFVLCWQIVDLVQNFYVGSPLGDLNPLSYPRLKKNMISTFMPALCVCVRIILNHAFLACLPAAIGEYWQWLFMSTPWRNEWGKCVRWPVILPVY